MYVLFLLDGDDDDDDFYDAIDEEFKASISIPDRHSIT